MSDAKVSEAKEIYILRKEREAKLLDAECVRLRDINKDLLEACEFATTNLRFIEPTPIDSAVMRKLEAAIRKAR